MSELRTAVLLMAYGTPRTADEILPYYTDIRRGRPPTDEQLADLVRRYDAIGGISPLTERTEAQREALQRALDAQAPGQFYVTLGLKHAAPMIETAVAELAAAGFTRIVGLVLAPHYSSYSIGQYMDRVRAAASPHGISLTAIESWATEPAFVEFLAADLRRRLAPMPSNTKVLFTAHSLPQRIIDDGDPYPDELRATAVAVAEAAGLGAWSRWAIAWQSAGRTPEPWIGPDILAVLRELGASENADGVLVSACGFVADHLEVLYDLDIEAKHLADELGLAFDRTTCVNDDPAVMAALAARVIGAVAG
ncbi:MAG: Ferrochelatase [Ilumatobacteraceae bacterium]|nr:Ferrochelatase [Ilumatobacteraceae bacterium]